MTTSSARSSSASPSPPVSSALPLSASAGSVSPPTPPSSTASASSIRPASSASTSPQRPLTPRGSCLFLSPLSSPASFAAVAFYLNTLGCDVLEVECWNGLLLLSFHVRNQPNRTVRILRCPLYPASYAAILPPLPDTSIHHGITYNVGDSEILPYGVGDGLAYFYFAIVSKKQQIVVDVYMLQDDTWAIYSSVVSEIPEIDLLLSTLIADDKIYSVARMSKTWKLFLLDLVSSTMSLVNLPEEVNFVSVLLSLANDSGVHLAHVKDLRIRIWLHRMDNNGVANWFLVNSICLREMCANNMIPSREAEYIRVYAVGENSEFVLLENDGDVYMFDLKRKTAEKIYEAREDEYVYSVSPFMMVWPPKFPAIMEGCDPKE